MTNVTKEHELFELKKDIVTLIGRRGIELLESKYKFDVDEFAKELYNKGYRKLFNTSDGLAMQLSIMED